VRIAALLLISAACSAPRAPAPADIDAAPAPDATPNHGSIISVTKSGPLSGTQTIPISPTHEGDNMVVIVSVPGGADGSLGVKIGGHVFVDLTGGPASPCGAKTELWYDGFVEGIDGGEAQVAVTRADATPYAVDVIEVAGANLFFDWKPAAPQDVPQGTAPSIPVDAGFVVVSTLTTCGSVDTLAPSSPFTTIDMDDLGTSVAYDIPSEAGSYGGAWSYGGADFTSASLALD